MIIKSLPDPTADYDVHSCVSINEEDVALEQTELYVH